MTDKMMEISTVNSTETRELFTNNIKVNTLIESLIDLREQAVSNALNVAKIVSNADDEITKDEWKEIGFKSLNDFLCQKFGYKPQSVKNLIRLGHRKDLLDLASSGFNPSALQELTNLSEEETKTAVATGIISPTMTVKTIREQINVIKGKELPVNVEETPVKDDVSKIVNNINKYINKLSELGFDMKGIIELISERVK